MGMFALDNFKASGSSAHRRLRGAAEIPFVRASESLNAFQKLLGHHDKVECCSTIHLPAVAGSL